MALQVKPGQWVSVTVKSQPRTAAGRKTLVRLFEQDPAIRKERERQMKTRPIQPARRGGRLWNNKPARLEIVSTQRGATYRVFASVAALKDLQSVENHVDVKPAS